MLYVNNSSSYILYVSSLYNKDFIKKTFLGDNYSIYSCIKCIEIFNKKTKKERNVGYSRGKKKP